MIQLDAILGEGDPIRACSFKSGVLLNQEVAGAKIALVAATDDIQHQQGTEVFSLVADLIHGY